MPCNRRQCKRGYDDESDRQSSAFGLWKHNAQENKLVRKECELDCQAIEPFLKRMDIDLSVCKNEKDVCAWFTQLFQLQQLGYRVVSFVDAGSYGMVFNVRDRDNVKAVVKVTPLNDDDDAEEKFKNGVRMQLRISRLTFPPGTGVPNVSDARIIDMGNNKRFGLLFMPYIGGTTLYKHLYDTKSMRNKLKYCRLAGKMLRSLHESGYEHNDLNLGNWIVDTEAKMIHLIDFDFATVGYRPYDRTNLRRDFNNFMCELDHLGDKSITDQFEISYIYKKSKYVYYNVNEEDDIQADIESNDDEDWRKRSKSRRKRVVHSDEDDSEDDEVQQDLDPNFPQRD